MKPQPYEIRVQGTLPPALRHVFRPLSMVTEDSGHITVLSGPIGSQGELVGILNAIDQLGLVLVEVRPAVPPPPLTPVVLPGASAHQL